MSSKPAKEPMYVLHMDRRNYYPDYSKISDECNAAFQRTIERYRDTHPRSSYDDLKWIINQLPVCKY